MAAAPDTALELLGLIRDLGIDRLCKVYRKPPLPSRLLRDLYALEVADTVLGHRFLAAYPLAPSDLLESLIQRSDDPETLTSAALNPRIPPQVLSRLAANPLLEVRLQTALNPQLSTRDLRNLARDLDRSVRAAAARNPALKPQIMAELTQDGDPAVRAALASRPDLFQEARFVLATDPSPIVRANLIAATEDPELLLFWAERDELDEQLAILRRQPLPDDVLASLLTSPHDVIRAAVRTDVPLTPELQFALVRDGSAEERTWLAALPDLAAPLQRLLSEDPAPAVRAAIAARPDLDPDLAAHFVTMHDEAACEALAANPATSPELLELLIQSDIASLPALLAYRDDLPPAAAADLLESPHAETFLRHLACAESIPASLPDGLLAPFARHPLPTVRAFIAAQVLLPPETRQALLGDFVPMVRFAMIENPSLTDLELEALLDDPDPAIAEAANQRWRTTRRARPTPAPLQTSPQRTEPSEFEHIETPVEAPEAPGVLRRLKNIFS